MIRNYNIKKGIKSQKSALVPQGEAQAAPEDNALNEVVSENVLYHPFENLMMTTGTLTPDKAAATTDIPSPSGDLAKPFSRSKRIDAQGGPTAWDQPDWTGSGIPKPRSRREDKSANSRKEPQAPRQKSREVGPDLPAFSGVDVRQAAKNDPKEGLASLAASVIGGSARQSPPPTVYVPGTGAPGDGNLCKSDER